MARLDLVDRTVYVGAKEPAVHGDHLAVEAVQGAEPEVAVLGELGEGHVPLVRAVEERADGRGLEQHVRLAVAVCLGPAQRLYVEVCDQPLVQHRARSLAP